MKEENQNLRGKHKPLAILQLVTTIAETTMAYNELSLPLRKKQDITFCTYYTATVSPSPEIVLLEGDGSLLSFFRNLHAALNDKEYRIIHVHMTAIGLLFLLANIVYRKSMKSTVFTVHNSYQNFKLRDRLILIPIFAFFRRVVCCSEASFASFPSFWKWLAGSRLCVVSNGVNIDRLDCVIGNERKYSHNEYFTLITVGRLIEIKNPLSVLNSFQQITDLASYLVFIGEGNLREDILTNSKSFGIEKQVKLTGLISREKVYKELSRADLFISASWGEGLPVATLEAMACGCPVLLSNIAPHREIAKGVNFIPLIQPDDVAGFAREIKRFKEMSTFQRAEIGKKCRLLVEEKFSLASMHKGYETIYNQIIS